MTGYYNMVKDLTDVTTISLEPMEITIKKSKKETKIRLSHRVAELVEKQDLVTLTRALKDLISEINLL